MCSSYLSARSKYRTQESIKYSIKVQRRNDMHPRVLIVGTVPYNTKSTSRAFDAYFHYWEKENIAQIFSNTKKPCKGHCETLFRNHFIIFGLTVAQLTVVVCIISIKSS